MFLSPPEETLHKAVFQPSETPERAWVVLFSYSMLSLVCMDATQTEAARAFRWNTHLALNDSRIFLEPKEVNIQALILLAVHGEDFASPNLSWMLMGLACQQAQALSLHRASSQQQLCLFWLLFALDKSCSLAFGRPHFLPSSTYGAVPLPEWSHLLNYNPHRGQTRDRSGRVSGSTFGAHVFQQTIELARLTAEFCDSPAPRRTLEDIHALKGRLDAWNVFTNDVCAAESAVC